MDVRRRCTTRVDEKLVASDDAGGGLAGWLVSYYVIVLVRGYAESTACRGMARLGGDCTSFANGQGGHVAIISAMRCC